MNSLRFGPSKIQQIFLVGVTWGLFVLALTYAPAPLSKRERTIPTPHPPPICTLTWGGVRYAARFDRDGVTQGTYQAVQNENIWKGTWRLEMDMQGRSILKVEEKLTSTNWLLWEVPLAEVMTDGTRTMRGGVPVRIDAITSPGT